MRTLSRKTAGVIRLAAEIGKTKAQVGNVKPFLLNKERGMTGMT